MTNLGHPSTSAQDSFQDDEIFDDSTFLANFDSTSFKETKVPEDNINDSRNTSVLNVSALCCDEEISGYDKLTGRTWIYPTNYPIRDYQFNIIQAALLKNTLVSLPTGLGKTFIAAVIMYNFYRWYPLGKIVFTAPTRPLVAQQIEACYNIIAIPPNDTIEMTGHMHVNTRKSHWQSKRVFFATPQVIYNDIKSGICPAEKIRCLVIDEAHRARGNYAYCQIVSTLDEMGHKTYRALALSATPGSKVDDVINVVKSLHISHLELRSENCIDVAPHSHSRKINTVIVQLGPELSQLRQHYVEILDGYARRLKQFNILPQNLGNLSKGRIVMLYKEFQTKDRGLRHPQHNYIMKDFTILISLYHGLELLVKHGSRVFLNFFDEHPEKGWIQADDRLTVLLERLRDDLGINPLSLDRSILPDGTIPEMPKDLCFGHPKFDKLKSIIVDHFTSAKQKKQDTRAIIFCEYRESVNLVHCLLLQCRPLISPQMFVGQGASGKDGKAVVSQKQQLRVMHNFRSGQCNTLVATCVAEEGLDVGSVDLIICFDISTRSPIRLVQRCGRTGRERGGQVHILVTEGREHQTLIDCMRQRDGLNKKILQSKEVESNLYKNNPRMMPRDVNPTCQKMFITVDKKNNKKDTEKADKKGQKDLRTMLLNNRASSGTSSSSKGDASTLITEEEFKKLFPDGYQRRKPFLTPGNHWAMSKESLKAQALDMNRGNCLNLASWLDWQRTLQKTVNIEHSKDSQFMCSTLQKCDAKRLESSQNPIIIQEVMSQNMAVPVQPSPVKTTMTTQENLLQNIAFPVQKSPVKTRQPKKKQKVQLKSPGKNYGDIRALFSTATKSTKSYTKLLNDLGIQNDDSVSTKLLNLLVELNLNIENKNEVKKCYVCENICSCKSIKAIKNKNRNPKMLMKFLADPILPDIDLIDEINIKCEKVAEPNQNLLKSNCSSNFDLEFDLDALDEMKSPEAIVEIATEVNVSNCSSNFDFEFDLDALDEMKSPEAIVEIATEVNVSNNKNFDLGDIDDIFPDSNPEDAIEKNIQVGAVEKINESECKPTEIQEELGLFGVDSIDDIFADYEDDFQDVPNPSTCHVPVVNSSKNEPLKQLLEKEHEMVTIEKLNDTNKSPIIQSFDVNSVPNSEYPVSPSILSGRQAVKHILTSPILCSQARKFKISPKKTRPHSSTPNSKAKKKLLLSKHDNSKVIVIEDDKDQKRKSSNVTDTAEKSMFTITQIHEMINKTNDQSFRKTVKTTVDVSLKENERSMSPILMTQADRTNSTKVSSSKIKAKECNNNKRESLIILDSDSDSEGTQSYDVTDEISKLDTNVVNTSQIGGKRKFDPNESLLIASPYFNKKQKIDNPTAKPLTLQEKVLAAITSNKTKGSVKNNNDKKNIETLNNQTNYCVAISQPHIVTQKENQKPFSEIPKYNFSEKGDIKSSPLDMLQNYRKRSKLQTLKSKFDSIFRKSPNKVTKSPKKHVLDESPAFMTEDRLSSPRCNTNKSNNKESTPAKRKISFDFSDDDFVSDDKDSSHSPEKPVNNRNKMRSPTNHKVRKKKRKHNSFLELEASLSDAGADSGDELTDDSAGSIADFICDDEDVTRGDIQAVYLESVRSPLKKNGFKIPELPQKYQREDIFSQYVEDDVYEMDSFCVDSHVGMTQTNDVSELELAEIVLEAKRRSKKKTKLPPQNNGDSPLVRRINKHCKRQIHSDSEDSS